MAVTIIDSLGGGTDAPMSAARVAAIVAAHERAALPRLRTFWRYYRNAPSGQAGAGAGVPRAAALAQAAGLPRRLVGDRRLGGAGGAGWDGMREVVIENDIAWRIHTMVEFMFGRPVRLASAAPDAGRAPPIGRIVEAVWEASGGIGLLQDMALLAHVYGHVDLVLRVDEAAAALSGGLAAGGEEEEAAARAAVEAGAVRVEVVEPTRGIPVMDGADGRRMAAYLIHSPVAPDESGPERAGLVQGRSRWLRAIAGSLGPAPRAQAPAVTEVLTAAGRRVYAVRAAEELPRLVDEAGAPVDLGRVPVVHIQNLSQPFCYEGLGDVEPLIPLQDELNTRLSDRASRVTMQSFKMYLAKGLDGFENALVGPGRIWSTDNPEASIEAFGGDAASPSEDRHIEEVREALDKASGVPPLATGVVRARVGNLTSENALRLTLTGLLSRTMRKRVTYGRGLAEMSALVLEALDALGIFRTTPGERAVRVEWPDPLPRDEREAVQVAQMKRELGVPADRLLAELGYATADPGVV